MSQQPNSDRKDPTTSPHQRSGGSDFIKLGLLFVGLMIGAYLLITILSSIWPR